jgi:hypothetical protein
MFFVRSVTYFNFYVDIPYSQIQICQTKSQIKQRCHYIYCNGLLLENENLVFIIILYNLIYNVGYL